MNSHLLAYLAGAMDSDGSFGIKRSTYHMRVLGDAGQPVFQERLSLKQITSVVPRLLKDTFGGCCHEQSASTTNGHPLWGWDATDVIASEATRLMRPYLRIKIRQADLILELRSTKAAKKYGQIAHWFAADNPMWRSMPLATFQETAAMLGYKSVAMVSQAVANGSLLALPWANDGGASPRIPVALIDLVKLEMARSKDGRARCRPAKLIAWRQRLADECRELNRIGTGKHPISERTGPYTPK